MGDVLFAGVVLGLVLAVGLMFVAFRGRGGQPGAAWAAVALLFVRVALAYFTLAWVLSAATAERSQSSIGGGLVSYSDGAMAVAAVTGDERTSIQPTCPPGGIDSAQDAARFPEGCAGTSAAALNAGGPSAQVDGLTLTIRVAPPTASEKRQFHGIEYLSLLAFFLGLFALERILARTVQRDPFAPSNVWWLRVAATAVVTGGFLATHLAKNFADALVQRHAVGPYGVNVSAVGSSHPASTAPIGVAVLILVLAEVWRFGIRLQEDVEATV